ncbi:MAG: hypothetical protein MJA28_05545 [Gammaproteobacteria bacterium]|nr:hypothetical protein [Gammaproteobacteria bacterium]
MDTSKKDQLIRKIPWPVLIMVVVFGVPYLFTWYLISSDDPIFFKKGQSNGQLIQPPRALKEAHYTTLSGRDFDSKSFTGKWTLLSIYEQTCDERCQQQTYLTRQVRLATGSDMREVQRVLSITTPQNIEALKKQFDEHKDLTVLIGPEQALTELNQALEENTESPFNHLYIIDPRGHVMMKYPANFEGKLILEDLAILLAGS